MIMISVMVFIVIVFITVIFVAFIYIPFILVASLRTIFPTNKITINKFYDTRLLNRTHECLSDLCLRLSSLSLLTLSLSSFLNLFSASFWAFSLIFFSSCCGSSGAGWIPLGTKFSVEWEWYEYGYWQSQI